MMLLKVGRLSGCSPNIGPLHFVTSSVLLLLLRTCPLFSFLLMLVLLFIGIVHSHPLFSFCQLFVDAVDAGTDPHLLFQCWWYLFLSLIVLRSQLYFLFASFSSFPRPIFLFLWFIVILFWFGWILQDRGEEYMWRNYMELIQNSFQDNFESDRCTIPIFYFPW